MTSILAGLKDRTVALLRGGTVPELTPGFDSASAAADAAIANAVASGTIAAVGNYDPPDQRVAVTAPAADADAGKGKKDKMGRMPGEDGYDPDDPADDEDASASTPQPPAQVETPPADPVAAERARWAAVSDSPEMKGREALAQHLLANSDSTAEQIIAALKVAPKASTGSVAAMLGHDNPDLGAGGDAGTGTDAAAVWGPIIAKKIEANAR